jgi:hypothetical protein
MASFNGLDLGLIFAMSTAANPKARQVNAYAGANGLEVLDHGSRGGSSAVEGALAGSTPAGLAAAEGTFRSLQIDGGGYVLVDTLGNSWFNVILVQFNPVGRVGIVAGGGYARRYAMEFLHVS